MSASGSRSARRRWPRARCHDDKGGITIEAVVVVPVAMLLLMLVVQAGVYFHTRAVAVTAAHHGLDAARVEPGSASDAQNVTETFLRRHAGGLRDQSVGVSRGSETATVAVSGDVVSLLFGVPVFSLDVTVRAPVERVVP
jgi:Flp pilus assembly protein TadG